MVDNPKFIPALTGIRCLSVYFIYFFHLSDSFSGKTIQLIFNQFYAFVSFLFVLSGFVIAYKYPFIKNFIKNDLKTYLWKRFSRIIPIFFILTTFTFLIQQLRIPAFSSEILKVWLLNISLLKGFSSKYILTGIGPSWSLSVEELFYVLAPLLLASFKKNKSILIIVLISYVIGFTITTFFIKFPFYGFFDSYIFTFHSTFFGRIFEFYCGIFLAKTITFELKENKKDSESFIATYLGLMLLILTLLIQSYIAMTLNISHASQSWEGVFVNNIILPISITIFFYGVITQKTIIQKILAFKLLVELGHSTYSFYLLHTSFILSIVIKVFGFNIFLNFITLIIISYIFYRTIEQPIAIFLRKKISKYSSS